MNLKVGDIVRITSTRPIDQGIGPYPCWTRSMDDCLGKIGKIRTIASGNCEVECKETLTAWYYAPHWLTKIENKQSENKQLLLI